MSGTVCLGSPRPNYLRHVVASFLIEYLGIDWRHGEAWFHDALVDADPAERQRRHDRFGILVGV